MSSSQINVTPVILSGGSGKRLWPLSRATFPKQFLALSGKTTLFQQALGRLQNLNSKLVRLNDFLIVTNEEHRFLVLDQLRETKNIKAQLLLEPDSRNTGPALTLAALQASEDEQDPILIVMPADQVIQNTVSFLNSLEDAINIAINGSIVVLGVTPTKPDTGFGYIQKHQDESEHHSFKVLNFFEKPDSSLAESFIKAGNYFWNSGIFILRASIWIEAVKQFSLEIYEPVQKAFDRRTNDSMFIRPDRDLFITAPSSSIDYAVIEKCPSSSFDIKMVILDAGWSDLGSWEAVWQVGLKDQSQNVSYGDSLLENTTNSLIYANHKLVATLGIDNIVVVETADAVLIANRNQSQNIRLIVDKLNLSKRKEEILNRKVSRPWGWYDNLDEGENFKVKRIQVNPGASLSLQKHNKRAEHWIVVKGTAEIICNDKKIILKENESTYIPLGFKHRLSNPGQDILEIIEVQSGTYLGEDDIERFDDYYGRTFN
ncbi:mannose-1-phosphate guanylyltransferase/mannose-6-phosphate isomerase [Candidatus Methylopumilus planktonicus]|uniref:mannose-1-phosphate guanylyltransferase/mannose-6-phosphate isomerase n=1 Tax=Candidatus Methylopumilus planktonicus TaxID=1581557 RepID=UPI00111D4243|nr:mannose-1-phosphate guanylyltransferase/mannose-6-phosphate isomerase [Candidatus Methylopumilus planktonicus]QDD07063.1 mannose-1-phosphate guanylyltransferase/mannose-6-phosphate isomerase [Candidatus Methylopumilus planktonicus]QDD08398.1 mannose-1-phosphate guanylyltransferase/mannose-6-phosphate isomerase [Candidatus Methylopumilus planktonicus]QDD09723.1 mannose-1-phosphate guanylyltransferase/mannose-6-phosphate isomerase [Candidatus Methylopumilus planktonicus]